MKYNMDQLADAFNRYCVEHIEFLANQGQIHDPLVSFPSAFISRESTLEVLKQLAFIYEDLLSGLNAIQRQWLEHMLMLDQSNLDYLSLATLLLASYSSDLGYEEWKRLYPQYAGYIEQAYVSGQAFFDRDTVFLASYA